MVIARLRPSCNILRKISALGIGQIEPRVSVIANVHVAMVAWDLAYRIRGSGKVRRVSLGRVADVSLEKARERANELTSAPRAGRDLIAEESTAEPLRRRGSRSRS